MILNKGSYKGKRILSEASVIEMTKNQVGQLLGPSRGFGLGFGVLYDATKKILVQPAQVKSTGVAILRRIFLLIQPKNLSPFL